MGVVELRRLRQVEDGNRILKQLVADLSIRTCCRRPREKMGKVGLEPCGDPLLPERLRDQRATAGCGWPKAAGAVVHTSLVIADHLLREGAVYFNLSGNDFDKPYRWAVARQLIHRLHGLGRRGACPTSHRLTPCSPVFGPGWVGVRRGANSSKDACPRLMIGNSPGAREPPWRSVPQRRPDQRALHSPRT